MKGFCKFLKIVTSLSLSLCLAVLLLSGCGDRGLDIESTTSTEEFSNSSFFESSSSEFSSSVPKENSTSKTTTSKTTLPSSTSQKTTAAQTTAVDNITTGSSSQYIFDCFDDCAFLGNSRLLALGNYSIAKNVYAKVGLTVNSVFTEKIEGGSVPVIDELTGKNFTKVFIMFGDNECGWGSLTKFQECYRDVVNGVRQRVPGARIYLLSILPISQNRSEKNVYGYNMGAIGKCNELIKELAAQEGLTYLDCASSVTGADGYLPSEYSTDGCHMKKEYNVLWAKYIADNM